MPPSDCGANGVSTKPSFPAPPATGSAPLPPAFDEEDTGVREARKQVAHRLVSAIIDLSGPERDALFRLMAIWLALPTSARYALYTVAVEFRDLLGAHP